MEQAIKENQYIKYYKNHSVKELRIIINSQEEYHDEARLGALEVLKNKKTNLTEEEEQLEQTLKATVENNFAKQQKEAQSKTQINKENELYSPAAIFGITIFCGAFIGAILLNINLRKVNKKNQSYIVIIIGLLLSLLNSFLFLSKTSQFVLLGVNLASALLFMEVFWKKYIGYTTTFVTKPIWKPLLIIVSITIILFAVQMYINPSFMEQLEQLQKINNTK